MRQHVSEEEAIAGSESTAAPTATGGHPEVRDEKRRRLSTGVKIALILGVGAAVVALIIGYKVSHPLSGVSLEKL